MRPWFQGTKRSMRTHAAPSCNLRPSLDLLEDRHLLSGGFEAIGVNPPAAIVVAIDIRDPSQVVEVVRFPSGPPTFHGGLFSQMPPVWGSLSFAPRDPWFAPGHGFQSHPEIQSQLVTSDSLTPPEFQEPSTGPPTSLSMTVSSTDSTSQESPPPGAPPPMPGPPPGAFPLLDFLRFKVDLMLREHGLEAKPLPEANAGNVAGDTEGAQGGIAAISTGSQVVPIFWAQESGNGDNSVTYGTCIQPYHRRCAFFFPNVA